MRRSLFLVLAVFVGGCVTRVNSPSVRPTYVAAPSGEWQSEVSVGPVERVRMRQHTDRKGFLWRRRVLSDTVDMRYEFRGVGAWTAKATARFVQASDVTTPIRIGSRSDDEDESDDRIWRYRGFHSTQRMQVGDDSSDVWELVSRIIPRARGRMLEEDGLPFAVVQASGGGLLGANDNRAWVPAGLTFEERQERVAVLIMLLMRDSRMPFPRAH